MGIDIFLTNNLSNKKEKFVPIDKKILEYTFAVQPYTTILILVMQDQLLFLIFFIKFLKKNIQKLLMLEI